jgi:hypothetical protein
MMRPKLWLLINLFIAFPSIMRYAHLNSFFRSSLKPETLCLTIMRIAITKRRSYSGLMPLPVGWRGNQRLAVVAIAIFLGLGGMMLSQVPLHRDPGF